jgi:hypothetical protein
VNPPPPPWLHRLVANSFAFWLYRLIGRPPLDLTQGNVRVEMRGGPGNVISVKTTKTVRAKGIS